MVKVKDMLFEDDPSAKNRTVKAQDELKKYLHFEKLYWQQKARYDWFENGDENIKLFNGIVKGRRKKLHVQRITDNGCNWLER